MERPANWPNAESLRTALDSIGRALAERADAGIDSGEISTALADKEAAKKKAKALLTSLLDWNQAKMLSDHSCFVAVGNETGDHYLIAVDRGNSGNVINLSTRITYCLVTGNGLPHYDQVISQMMMIQCEESNFKFQANILRRFTDRYAMKAILGNWLAMPQAEVVEMVDAAPEREVVNNSSSIFDEAGPTMTAAEYGLYRERVDLRARGGRMTIPQDGCRCPMCEEARGRDSPREPSLYEQYMDYRERTIREQRIDDDRQRYISRMRERELAAMPADIRALDPGRTNPCLPSAYLNDQRYWRTPSLNLRVTGECNAGSERFLGEMRSRGWLTEISFEDLMGSGPSFEATMTVTSTTEEQEVRELLSRLVRPV